MSYKNKIKRLIPHFILVPLQRLHNKIGAIKRQYKEAQMISRQPNLHQQAIAKIRRKSDPINVVFFALFDSVWKYDTIFRIMQEDPRFNPSILVCPVVNYSKENMIMNMNNCCNLFKSKGYNVIPSYNEDSDKYVDVRQELHPDIIFYTSPYEGLIDNRYFICNFADILTVYVNYYYSEGKDFNFTCDLLLHNLVWRRYCEHTELLSACKNTRNKGINAIYTGYPGTDNLIQRGKTFKDVWKLKDRSLKRIIWAPHHTITNYAFVNYSTFLSYYDFMFEMAEKYKDKIQICFKPHPILKNRLEIEWGKERTNAYYQKWKNLPNGMLNDGEYEDLFMTSDAMIHDSGSFIAEYLYTKNPCMYLSKGIPFEDQYNDMALKCLSHYYIGRYENDIETFILNLINGIDIKKNQRIAFVESEMMPPNDKLASENIIDDIVKELNM